MADFRFRLTTLLKLRETTRDERRRQLADGFRAAATLQERIDETHGQLADVRDICATATRPGLVTLDRLLDAQRYETALRGQLQVYEQQSARVAEEIEHRRQLLIEADRDVRVLEMLREKQWERHRERLARDEIKLLDELAGRISREATGA